MSEKENILRLFKETNTYHENGHFKLVSGNHSDTYFQVRLALSFDNVANEISKLLAEKYKNEKIDKIIGFTVSGNILATKIAKLLNAIPILGEKKKESTFSFLSGNEIDTKDYVLIVEDVLTTEEHIIPVINAIKKSKKGKLIGIGIVVDRRTEETDLGIEIKALLRIKPNLWSPETCPLCKHGIPLTDFSSPDTDPFTIFLSIPEETRKTMIKSYENFIKKTQEDKLYDEIVSYYEPRHELPGKKYERVAVLGSFDNFSDMQHIAQIVAKQGYYAVTSLVLYQKGTAERKGWGPYDYETMNDFLGRMIFSCQYAVIIYAREGGQFIETMWCSQSNKPTLGIVYLRPWDLESPKSCEYMLKGPKSKYTFCNGFQAVKIGSKKAGGYICVTNKDCPFPSSKLTKMILDFYTTSSTMYLVGSDCAENIVDVINNFLEYHGNIDFENLSQKVG